MQALLACMLAPEPVRVTMQQLLNHPALGSWDNIPIYQQPVNVSVNSAWLAEALVHVHSLVPKHEASNCKSANPDTAEESVSKSPRLNSKTLSSSSESSKHAPPVRASSLPPSPWDSPSTSSPLT